MDKKALWQAALGELEIVFSKANFITWLKNTFIHSFENGSVVIGVPSAFNKEWLQNKLHNQILETLNKLSPVPIKKIEYKVISQQEELNKINPLIVRSNTKTENRPGIGLSPKYRFENFIIGSSNRLAKAAAQAVAKNLGKSYNPLFIYGGVGLGKTHLMQAIGNEVLEQKKNKKVIYATCEEFTNEFIRAIQTNKINSFKEKYRDVDLFLIDDIQFLVGKDSTKEEFFHTFNALYQQGRQIVISSDRPPTALSVLEDRLVSRFQSGMVVDIALPDLETRAAILKQKRKEKGFPVPDEVINLIAQRVQKNIRELEGALTRIIAACQLSGEELTLELADQILTSLGGQQEKISLQKILEQVANFYGLDKESILDKKRDKRVALPRQIAMYLIRHELNYSFPEIGRQLKKDHSTVMYACDKIEKKIVQNSSLKQEISLIKTRLRY